MSNTVLAAVDLVHPQQQAVILKKARQLADLEDAVLAVITVIPDFGMSIVGSYFEKGVEKKAMQAASEQLHRLVADVLGANAKVKHIVAHGNAYEEILDLASKLDVSLIVMGAHKPNFQDYLIGPNAARVVRHSKCSVHVIRE